MALLGTAGAAYAGVSVSQPSNGATVPLSMRVVASATPSSSSYHISAVMIYVNSSKVYSTSNSSLDTTVSVKTGSNRVQVKAWDSSGAYFEKLMYVTGSSSVSSGAGVNVSSPSSSSVSSPAHFVVTASPSSGHTISYMAIYSNSSKVYSTSKSSIDTYVSLASGSDRVQVKAWDTGGHLYEKTLYLTVGSSSTSTSSTAVNLSSIDERTSGWFSCDGCAGAGASGPSSTYWMKTGISSPSKDGKSAEFFLGGTTPYANALWSQALVTDATKLRNMHHFVNDLYWYYTNSHAAQGFEFNISQYIDGYGYIYGIQCNLRSGSGPHWDISVPKDYSKPLTLANMKWQNTGVTCSPKTYSWNHVTLEFERTSGNSVKFVALTLNGTKHYINVTVPRRIAPSDWKGLNTHFQMNGNYQQEDYKAWVDRWRVTYW